ncbi:hypothetical protein HMPREF0389_00297 [Filifactor alocis ATCC 35896]|jgi:Uncharacterized protein conserved in bacteria|uniref:UPF0291 protein HMPREF0389_00297 n=1 Tax=Filifactor alocis (strain ATCC 35896 / CCUG 47790 / D40 B5) TaxID=546269 RepID=D6GRU1_FILAD|nr:DUF896 domain-containing protein [Filifactor alocis]EFE28382.1 hypothetical protein HMPREF0389_00297 [Filifactor alocis ATCC 35896]
MKPELINRINVLAHKSKTEGLTEDEKIEQQQLRKEYLDAFRKNFKKQLDNIEIEYRD